MSLFCTERAIQNLTLIRIDALDAMMDLSMLLLCCLEYGWIDNGDEINRMAVDQRAIEHNSELSQPLSIVLILLESTLFVL